MSAHSAEKDAPRPVGRLRGGMKSGRSKAAYWRTHWRMRYESAIGALADLIAENTENVEFARDFYGHNADLLSDYWRAEFTRVFGDPDALRAFEPDPERPVTGNCRCACRHGYYPCGPIEPSQRKTLDQ